MKKYFQMIQICGFVLVVVGIFLFPFLLREMVGFDIGLGDYRINFIALLGIFFLCSSLVQDGILRKDRIPEYIYLLMIPILMYLYYHSVKGVGISRDSKWSFLFCCILPLILCCTRLEADTFQKVYSCFLIFLNVIMIALAAWAVIDFFCDRVILKSMAPYLPNEGLIQYYATYYSTNADADRFASIYFHPLNNAELFVIYYILNSLGRKYLKKGMPLPLAAVIACVGVALTASKFAMAIIAVVIILSVVDNIKLLIAGLAVGGAALGVGLFDKTIYRWMNTPLTTGRYTSWLRVLDDWSYPFRFWKGYGYMMTYRYEVDLSGVKAAFEFPVFMFALDHGMLFSGIITALMILYPTYRLLRNKQWYLWMMFAIVTLEVETYNGVSLATDMMLIYAFFTFMMLNFGKMVYELEMIPVSKKKRDGKKKRAERLKR